MTRRNNKSEIVQASLSKEMKYLATIAARKQRKTLSEFVRWAVDQQLKNQETKDAITE